MSFVVGQVSGISALNCSVMERGSNGEEKNGVRS